ncbi:ATP-binding protein [Roseococcus microcysteis]|uniref:ATP-binding protein n=1 Tax=Roseococcus microcysteis TaxID=2771361 RepID=UPI00168BEE4A|nr:ATP-binding protein [Roseococcus microcysteis]
MAEAGVEATVVPLAELARLLDSMGLAMCVFDARHRTRLWNDSFLRYFPEHAGHVYPGESYAENLRRFYAARLSESEAAHMDRYIADGILRHERQSWPFEFVHRGRRLRVAVLPMADGGRLRVWVPLGLGPGGEAGLAEEHLPELRQDEVPLIADGAMVRDEKDRILSVNNRFAAIYGLDHATDAQGQDFRTLVEALWAGRPGAAEARVALTDNPRFEGAPFEVPLPGDRWVRVSERRTQDGIGISVHVDVTDLVRLERAAAAAQLRSAALAASLKTEMEERRRTEAALQRSQRAEAIGQLTGGVAHDFNNLFAVIQAGLDLLEATPEDARRPGRMAMLRDAVARGAALTGQLLAFSRRQPLEPRAVALAPLLEGMLPLLGTTCGSAVEITLDLPPDPPVALVDPTQLEFVVLNLAVNARDAMPEGGRLMLSLGTETLAARQEEGAPDPPLSPPLSPGRYAVLTVRDTGIGMSEAVRSRALEPFFTTKGDSGGSGLGLSQTQGLARQSGGMVRIESAPGQGTAVHLLLPAIAGPAQPRGPDAAKPFRKLRLLLVEDEASVRMMLADLLAALGHSVTSAPDGTTALGLLAEGLAPDVLITDMRMPPGLSGPELARAAWRDRPDLPVLFVSRHAEPELEQLDGRSLLLRKPCRPDDLQQALRRLVCGHALS